VLETRTRTLVPTNIHQHGNQRSNERLSLADPNPSVAEHCRVELSATASLLRLPGHPRSSGPIFPATCLLSATDSACFIDSTSLVPASPESAAMLDKRSLDACSTTMMSNALKRDWDRGVPLCYSSYEHQPTSVSTTYPPDSCISHYHTSTHPPVIRPIRDPIHLPSITREGRIIPLGEDYEPNSTNYVGNSPPLVNDPEFSLVLLQPVQCFGHTRRDSLSLYRAGNHISRLVPHLPVCAYCLGQ
jgi:hypothetical protein